MTLPRLLVTLLNLLPASVRRKLLVAALRRLAGSPRRARGPTRAQRAGRALARGVARVHHALAVAALAIDRLAALAAPPHGPVAARAVAVGPAAAHAIPFTPTAQPPALVALVPQAQAPAPALVTPTVPSGELEVAAAPTLDLARLLRRRHHRRAKAAPPPAPARAMRRRLQADLLDWLRADNAPPHRRAAHAAA